MSDLCLALDLSSPKGSLCVFEESSALPVVFYRELPGLFTHSESLLHELENSLVERGILLDDVKKWITPCGPGSFTGLRIAYATLKAFALAKSKPIITVEGPEARAMAYYEEVDPKREASQLDVLSYLTADKFVISSFQPSETGLKKIAEAAQTGLWMGHGENVVLTDSEKSKGVLFPLRANHLRFFSRLSSKKEHSPKEVAELAPLYFGSSHFD